MSRARAILEADPKSLLRKHKEQEQEMAGEWPLRPGDKGYLFMVGEGDIKVSLNMYAPTRALAVQRANAALQFIFGRSGVVNFKDRFDTAFHFDWTALQATEDDIYDEWDIDPEQLKRWG